jgi:uncharacterized membrane protein YecN with MAPEG domain
MTSFQIIGLYTALYILFLIFLTLRVIRIRFGNMISMGDGGNDVLAKRVRAHGNYIESAPFMMFALFGMAFLGGLPLMIHIFAASFFFGRVLHSIGMVGSPANLPRQIGMVLSLTALLGAALYLLFLIFSYTAV